MTFAHYIKLLLKIVVSSTFILALLIGVPILFTGDDPAEARLTLEFDAIEGLAIIVVLPLLTAVVFALLSPLSFFVFKLMSRPKDDDGENLPEEPGPGEVDRLHQTPR